MKKKIKNMLMAFLCLMIVASLFESDLVQAAQLGWSSMPVIYTNEASGYSSLGDIATYGINRSTNGSDGMHFDSAYGDLSTRVLYQKRINVSYGETINLVEAGTASGIGGPNISNVQWNVMEYDASGYPLWDSGWLSSSQAWQAGVSTYGADEDFSRGRESITYVVLIFRYASQANITPQELSNVCANLYLRYAPWRHTIAYNANGGSGAPASQTKTYGSILTLSSTKPIRKGYTFAGWNTAVNGTGSAYAAGQAYGADQAGGTVNLYAQWSRNKYTVTYNANGGTTSQGTRTYYYNSSIDLSPVAEKPGMIFVGWSTSKNAAKAITSLKMPDLATSSNTNYSKDWELTLYAVYSIPVSDVSNHIYPEYEQINEEEVFFRVWDVDNTQKQRIFPLTYTKDVNTMEYRYILPSTNIASFVNGMRAYGYQVLAYDNAGNYKSLYVGGSNGTPTPPPMPEKYLQTVNHYRYDVITEEWVKFDTTTELVLEGITYTPVFITAPTGYKANEIEEAYVVSKAHSSNAYYMPVDYTLTFDANGGTCNTTEKSVTYGDYYGTMPTPTKTGHRFLGWYTEKEKSTVVLPSDKYLTAGDTTLYAHWEVLSYPVIYDYWTNEGTEATKLSGSVPYGTSMDLSAVATKESEHLKEWQFIGWNTNPDAKEGLDSITMPDYELTLYAIYQKDITVTIQEQTDDGTVTRDLRKSIYNREKEATFLMEQETEWTDWTFLGWTTEISADEAPIVGIGGQYTTCDSTILYGVYTSIVTLTYDTNGSSMVIMEQTKDSYYNASGESLYPEFIIADEPQLSQHSFVSWEVANGSIVNPNGERTDSCFPEEQMTVKEDTLLTATWDKHPEIEAYDRYFTLEEAQQGEITETELLEKVTATDKEDGILENGRGVIVKDFDALKFTSLTEDDKIEITYQATDSFGNVVTKTITANVTDTSMKKSATKQYVRFISSQFFMDEGGGLVSEHKGGLEDTSVWRTDSNRFNLLQIVLQKDERNADEWIFTREDIKKMKQRISNKKGEQ